MKNVIPNFVVFEGTDGSGTTTQLSRLDKRLSESGFSRPAYFLTCEPTNSPVGALIRSALKKDIGLHADTLARLFAADRCEHLYGEGGIVQRCSRGELVICDRYILSSLVYQGLECGDELPQELNGSFPVPELIIHLDLDSEIAQQRLNDRAVREIYENLEFQRKVRDKYLSLLDGCRKEGSRVELIDAAQSLENVSGQVWRIVSDLPIFKPGF